jgi:hypothetical protein
VPGSRLADERHDAHTVNGEVIGPGAYRHLPAGETMFHAPAGGEACLFVTNFHGPFDVEPVGGEPRPLIARRDR